MIFTGHMGASLILLIYIILKQLPVETSCVLYDNSLGKIRWLENHIEADGWLSTFFPLREACIELDVAKYIVEHPYTAPHPEDENIQSGYSIAVHNHDEKTITVLAGNARDSVMYRYYPGLQKFERLDDTIASICPVFPPLK